MDKYTPGPYCSEKRSDGNIEITDGNGSVLATVYGDDNDPRCWPVSANADLLSAAPELLEVCKNLIEQHDASFSGREDMRGQYYSAHPHRHEAYKRARAAITKATGGQS